jgi:hypothetical protein
VFFATASLASGEGKHPHVFDHGLVDAPQAPILGHKSRWSGPNTRPEEPARPGALRGASACRGCASGTGRGVGHSEWHAWCSALRCGFTRREQQQPASGHARSREECSRTRMRAADKRPARLRRIKAAPEGRAKTSATARRRSHGATEAAGWRHIGPLPCAWFRPGAYAFSGCVRPQSSTSHRAAPLFLQRHFSLDFIATASFCTTSALCLLQHAADPKSPLDLNS